MGIEAYKCTKSARFLQGNFLPLLTFRPDFNIFHASMVPPASPPAPHAIEETPFVIPCDTESVIRGDLRHPREGGPFPLVLVCHGFTAHKDWGPFPHIGRALAEEGLASAVFNFSHNGMAPPFRRFTEIEKFSRNTIGREIVDVRALLDAAAGGAFAHVDRGRIGIMGHSRGGGVAIIAAAGEARLRAVAGWGTVATFQRFTAHQKEAWERDGFLPVTVRGKKTRLSYGIDVLRDLLANAAAYDIRAAASRLRVPLLLVHGEADVSVNPDEPRSLRSAAGAGATLVVIPGTGHAFGAEHPFRASTAALDRAIALSAGWFRTYL